MTAKGANIALENMTRRLNRTTYPRLPPAPGFEGDTEFAVQLEIWKKWIAYEKDDPLVLKDDEPAAFKQRVLYCFKQALMAMRFVPELWVDAAEWCFKNQVVNGTEDVGLQFLTQGVAANPESVLLALKHADRIESTFPRGDSEEAKQKHADAVHEPYNALLDTLYDMGNQLRDKEQTEIAEAKKAAPQADARRSPDGDEDENKAAAQMKARVAAITASYGARSELLSKTISHVWIALARAMRRIQGKGRQNKNAYEGGLRQTFLDARKRGRLTSDVYVAVAQMESVVYGDAVGAKIFERGLKLFPTDEYFVLEYLKHLHSKNDTTSKLLTLEPLFPMHVLCLFFVV
jgi:cleavage stimulation factor subunit 3